VRFLAGGPNHSDTTRVKPWKVWNITVQYSPEQMLFSVDLDDPLQSPPNGFFPQALQTKKIINFGFGFSVILLSNFKFKTFNFK
jgi:hypothetical protein